MARMIRKKKFTKLLIVVHTFTLFPFLVYITVLDDCLTSASSVDVFFYSLVFVSLGLYLTLFMILWTGRDQERARTRDHAQTTRHGGILLWVAIITLEGALFMMMLGYYAQYMGCGDPSSYFGLFDVSWGSTLLVPGVFLVGFLMLYVDRAAVIDDRHGRYSTYGIFLSIISAFTSIIYLSDFYTNSSALCLSVSIHILGLIFLAAFAFDRLVHLEEVIFESTEDEMESSSV
jgi:hypothetical protein